MSEALLYEAEDQHRHDRLEPGLLLPQLSHTHKVAVKVFLQTRLPGECFPPGTATCILLPLPSRLGKSLFLLSPLSFGSESARKGLILF